MINFVIIGGGWRAEFYLRIAKAIPQKFHVSAICVRNPERRQYIADKFHVKALSSIKESLQEPFDFIVNCINKDDISDLSVKLADRGYYVLSETPVIKAPVAGHCYEKIQVAEQFHLKGTYQALKKIIDAGVIGAVNHIQLSVAHDYHAMSLLRFLLEDYEEPHLISSHILDDKMVRTHGRIGEFAEKTEEITQQQIKMYQFKNTTAIYDYNIEQYFSPIRKERILIRGTKGEIENNQVRYLNRENKAVSGDIKTVMSGLLDGFYIDKITFEDKTLFEFPFKEARLSEEEIAIAQCLIDMNNYTKTGNELYPYKRAYEDYIYLG